MAYVTYLCPISCAMVNAEDKPVSSLMLQLLSNSHIPATGARPESKKRNKRVFSGLKPNSSVKALLPVGWLGFWLRIFCNF